MPEHEGQPDPRPAGGGATIGRRPGPNVTKALIAVNAAVFLLWQAARTDPELWPVMWGHFSVSAVHLGQGRWWTLLTSVFSHNQLWHIAINMLVLWSFGSFLERLVGSRFFLGFYLVSGVFASLSHCVVETVLLGQPNVPALGASGAVSAVLLAYALLFPRHRILLFGVIPMPALIAALLFVGLDIFGLVAQGRGGGLPIGHGAHLGGALAGFVTWLAVLRPRFAGRLGAASGPIALTRDELDEVERLRDKLSRDGVDALTAQERDFLSRLHERR